MLSEDSILRVVVEVVQGYQRRLAGRARGRAGNPGARCSFPHAQQRYDPRAGARGSSDSVARSDHQRPEREECSVREVETATESSIICV